MGVAVTAAAFIKHAESLCVIVPAFGGTVNHIQQSGDTVMAQLYPAPVDTGDGGRVDLSLLGIVKTADPKVFGGIISVPLGRHQIAQSHVVVGAEHGVGQMQSQLFPVFVGFFSVGVEKTHMQRLSGGKREAVFRQTVPEGGVALLIFFIGLRASQIVQLSAAVNGDHMLRHLIKHLIIVNADTGLVHKLLVNAQDFAALLQIGSNHTVDMRGLSHTVYGHQHAVIFPGEGS